MINLIDYTDPMYLKMRLEEVDDELAFLRKEIEKINAREKSTARAKKPAQQREVRNLKA